MPSHAYKMVAIFFLAALAWPLLGGCSTTDHQALIAFMATANGSGGCGEYRVMPPDILSINAMPTEEYINLIVRVGPDGRSFLPLIGEYDFAGKSTTQIAAEITAGLRGYYEDVQVTVAVERYQSQRYYVFGEVTRPGVYPFTGTDSLISALAAAEPTRLAQQEKVYLVRGLDPLPNEEGIELDSTGRIKNKVQKVAINLLEMTRDGKMSANLLLANNDVIYVPANPAAKVGLALQNLLLPARPVIEAAHVPTDTLSGTQPDMRGARNVR
ncbi:MAG: polysaccharide export protein [Planctomycetes bacterium]|nr:polysaccharide export protein [Planctomycetota bacterium]